VTSEFDLVTINCKVHGSHKCGGVCRAAGAWDQLDACLHSFWAEAAAYKPPGQNDVDQQGREHHMTLIRQIRSHLREARCRGRSA
jgi:hypothetical protein